MTAEQLAEWMERGANPPTIDEARVAVVRMHATLVAVTAAIETLQDEMIADADKVIELVRYRAENAREYSLLCAWTQRLMDIQTIAAEAAQR